MACRNNNTSATTPPGPEAVKNSDNRSVTVAARKHAAMRSTAYRAASVNAWLHKRWLVGLGNRSGVPDRYERIAS